MKSFEGTWKDQPGTPITVNESEGILKIDYQGSRGPFSGFAIYLAAPVINADFPDDRPATGVLSEDNKVIYWSNDSKWSRVE